MWPNRPCCSAHHTGEANHRACLGIGTPTSQRRENKRCQLGRESSQAMEVQMVERMASSVEIIWSWAVSFEGQGQGD